METAESLRRRIGTAEDLQSVVKTMKALAAMNVREYERVMESLEAYGRALELGLHAVLRTLPARPRPRMAPRGLGLVVYGSDQGMCGALNEQVVAHAVTLLAAEAAPGPRALLAVGLRAASGLEAAGVAPEDTLPVPTAAAGLMPLARDVLVQVEAWHARRGIQRVLLVHARPLSGASVRPRTVQLLPLDPGWLEALRTRPWPSRCLPAFSLDRDQLFSALVRQHLFASVYRAFTESLASENASRLASMEGAERNIADNLNGLRLRFHQHRQTAITEELLDIVAGFEALREDGRGPH